MSKMKILWLSNRVLSGRDICATGTWLEAMAQGLVSSGHVELGNISAGNIAKITRQDNGPVCQWVVPLTFRLDRNGLPHDRTVADIVSVVEEFSPDLVHVWGTESYWGLLTGRKLIKQVALLETQGLKFAIAKVFHGDLSFREQLECIGFKEILRRSAIPQWRNRFEKWGLFEKEIISHHHFITVQTAWLESQVRQFNLMGKIYHNDFALREPFLIAQPWSFPGDAIIFCTAAYPCPFKGLHVAVRAVALLKRRFPSVQLRIAGAHRGVGIRRDGYIAWINRELNRLGIKDNVIWLGPLTATQIVSEMQKCSAIVIPTFIEGYCLGLAEAMMLGVPSVVSYAGGVSCIAQDEESAIFFSPGDEAMCAYQLERVLTDRELAIRLSQKARKVAIKRNDSQKVVAHQLEIYRQVISESRGNLT